MTTNLSVSQNFLKSRSLVHQIVQLADIQPNSTVLEIGAGKGIITRQLAKQVTAAGKVIALEFDDGYYEKLRETFADVEQIDLRHEDILQLDLAQLPKPYTVFANIPFNITAPLLESLLNTRTGPTSAFLILQKDTLVGLNKGGQETETFKSLLIAPLYKIGVEYEFDRTDFWPRPSIETALFSFKRRDKSLIKLKYYEQFKDFLAFVSRDRVGEGSWLKLFSKKQLGVMDKQTQLVLGRGLKSQSVDGIMAAFGTFLTISGERKARVAGAMQTLREEQARREKISRAGGHHRKKKKASER